MVGGTAFEGAGPSFTTGSTMSPTVMTLTRGTSRVNSATYSLPGCITTSAGVPIWTTQPSFMIAMRSASRSASRKSWVINTIVLCSNRCKRRNSSCICRLISGSSALKGSSRNQISGSTARLRAIPTRCCWPPDSSRGKLSSRPSRPTSLTTLAALFSRSAREIPWTLRGKATFSSTVWCGRRPKFWNTMPILWRRISINSRSDTVSRSSPSSKTSPAVGSTRRDRHRTMVDLPEPESPMMMNISPRRTSKLTLQAAAM